MNDIQGQILPLNEYNEIWTYRRKYMTRPQVDIPKLMAKPVEISLVSEATHKHKIKISVCLGQLGRQTNG